MTTFLKIALLVAGAGLAGAVPVMAQTRAEEQRFQQAQQRYDNEQRIYRTEYDRYQQARSRSGYRDPRGGYNDQRGSYNDPRNDQRGYSDSRYSDPRYDDRTETGYDPARSYRDGSGYQERTLSADDRVYRGSDNRYYCKRGDGTTGLIVGAVGGGVLGNVIAGGHSRGVGTILGAIGGGLLGKTVDQNSSEVRCR